MRQPERQHNRKGVRETSNQKYEITDIAHEKYPFLHRIRALRDIRPDIKAGDLGGFVEGEHNLETELSDSASSPLNWRTMHGSMTTPLSAITATRIGALFFEMRRSCAATAIFPMGLS